MTILYQWIDVIWIPLAVLAAHKGHRLMAAGYALAVILMLRLQTELLVETGFPNGIVNLIDMPVFWRGMIVYAVLTTLYLVLAHFSRGSERVVFLAATISMFFTGLLLSTIVMVL